MTIPLDNLNAEQPQQRATPVVVVHPRPLSARELATIRAALRLWIDTPPDLISDRCYQELDGVAAESDEEIEQLLAALTFAQAHSQVVIRSRRHDG